MKNVVITKDSGTDKANAQAKAELTELIMNALIAELGEENVAMVRQAYIDDLTAKTQEQEKEAKAKAKTEKIERDKKAREEKKLSKEKETETTAEGSAAPLGEVNNLTNSGGQ